MYWKLSSKLQFEEVMSLKGDVYRQLEGRTTQRVVLSGAAYFLKCHLGVGWKEVFKNLLQLKLPVCGAKNEWQALERLAQLNIAVPDVVGYAEKGFNPARKHSFVLTKELTNFQSLEDHCKTWQQSPPHFTYKQDLLKKIALITRKMHISGINHRDLYICHFVLADPLNTLYLIDLHRAQIRKKTPLRWVIKDLAALYFSSKDIGLTTRDELRFIKAYQQKSWRDLQAHEQQFWQKVKQRGDRMYQKHGKSKNVTQNHSF